MTILENLFDIISTAKLDAKFFLENEYKFINIKFGEDISANRLYLSDNLNCIVDLMKNGYKGKIDLIYLDPPFFTNLNFKNTIKIKYDDEEIYIKRKDFTDKYDGGLAEYIYNIALRLVLIKELMSDKGSIYIHVDSRVNHYIRFILDEVFGERNFVNEIIWAYKSGGASKRRFARKHDNIYFYSKTNNYIFNQMNEKSYNRGLKPYKFKNIMEYQDELGWYTIVKSRDVWMIDMVGRTSSERVKYSTQKPLELLKKIILASSNENSLIADFYLGSGSTAVAADILKRRWIGCDQNPISIITLDKRLNNGLFQLYIEEKYLKEPNRFIIELKKINKQLDIFIKDYLDPIKELAESPSLFVEQIYICKKYFYEFKILSKIDKSTIKNNKFEINIPDSFNSQLYAVIVDVMGNVDYHKLI